MLLWEGVYPYKYTDNCGKFNETSLPEKGDFYSHVSKEDNTNGEYTHTKYFEIENVGEYHDLYVQINKLVLADVFENFWNMCREIGELDKLIFSLYQD